MRVSPTNGGFMSKAMLFYIGAGVLNFGGKDYGYGEELPSGIPKETIDSLRAKKHISDAPPTAATASTASDTGALKDQVAMLTAKVEGLTGKLEEAAVAYAGLEKAMETEIARLNGTIEEMTRQMMTPPAPPVPPVVEPPAGAGPAKK